MATKKEPEEIVESTVDPRKYWAERVPFRAFKDNGRYKEDITVGWNGKIYVIQRGRDVMIPRAVREIIYQSMEQDQRTAELIEREESRFNEESKIYT